METSIKWNCYLDKKGVQLKVFQDNYPGDVWISLFIRRHCLTQRIAENVKPARAEVDRQVIDEFFLIIMF